MDDDDNKRDTLFRNAENASADESSQVRRTITMVRQSAALLASMVSFAAAFLFPSLCCVG